MMRLLLELQIFFFLIVKNINNLVKNQNTRWWWMVVLYYSKIPVYGHNGFSSENNNDLRVGFFNSTLLSPVFFMTCKSRLLLSSSSLKIWLVVEISLMYVSGKQFFLKFKMKSHFLIIILELAMEKIMIDYDFSFRIYWMIGNVFSINVKWILN